MTNDCGQIVSKLQLEPAHPSQHDGTPISGRAPFLRSATMLQQMTQAHSLHDAGKLHICGVLSQPLPVQRCKCRAVQLLKCCRHCCCAVCNWRPRFWLLGLHSNEAIRKVHQQCARQWKNDEWCSAWTGTAVLWVTDNSSLHFSFWFAVKSQAADPQARPAVSKLLVEISSASCHGTQCSPAGAESAVQLGFWATGWHLSGPAPLQCIDRRASQKLLGENGTGSEALRGELMAVVLHD